jgi:hypothetical protein
MDITLARTKSAIVHARARSALGGRALRSASITLYRSDSKEAGYLPARFQTKPLEDGTFEIRGVVPGTYYIEASAAEERKTLHARQLLVVNETPEVNVNLLLAPEVAVEGVVITEGKEPVQYSSLRLAAEPRIDAPVKTVSVGADGTFKLSLLAGVEYRVILTNAPENVYLKSARLDAFDVLTRGLAVTSTTPVPLNIAVATAGGMVQGWSTPSANVLLMPGDGRLERYQSAVANEYGVFRFRGVAPGDYRVISWFDNAPCEVHDPEARAACNAFGMAVNVAEAGNYTVETEPADKIEARISSGQ